MEGSADLQLDRRAGEFNPIDNLAPLAKAGVTDGDTVVAINNVPTPSWAKVDQFLSQVVPDSTLRFSVDHAGTQQIVEVKAADLKDSDQALGTVFVPPIVGQVTWMKPAKRAGMKRGDLILSVNNTPVKTWQQYVELIRHGDGHELILSLTGETGPSTSPSRVTVRVGDRVLVRSTVGREFRISARIPAEAIAGDDREIIVETDRFVVPAERSWRTRDRRRLGLRIYDCQLRPVSWPDR